MGNKYYWTCPYCGANLDHGETCDCRKEVENQDTLIGSNNTLGTASSDIADDYKVVTGGVNE